MSTHYRPLARGWHDLASVVIVSRASDGGVWVKDEIGATRYGPCDWTALGYSWRTAARRVREGAEYRKLLEMPRSVAMELAHPK